MNNHSAALTRSDHPDAPRPNSRPATVDAASEQRARPSLPPQPADSKSLPKKRLRWGRILVNVYNETNRDNVSVMAAGVAFWTFLSIFPGLSALISIYGLIADPTVIAVQVSNLAGVLPPSTLALLYDQLTRLISAPPQALGLGLVVSLLLTLFYSMSGTGTVMQALTVAYEERDTRGILAYYAQSAALTIGIAVFGLLSLFLVAIVPAVLDWLPFPKGWRDTIGLVRWPVLAVLTMLGAGGDLPLRSGAAKPVLAFVLAGNDRRRDRVAGRLGRVLVLRREFLVLRQDLRLARHRRDPADVALSQLVHRAGRRRTKFGDRAGADRERGRPRSEAAGAG